jgi:hypothetical protein
VIADDLAKLRALCAAASPAPWRNGADPSHFDAPEVTDDKTFSYYITTDADAAFVAAARSALPQLLDEVERLRESTECLEGARSDLARQLAAMTDARDEMTRTRDEACNIADTAIKMQGDFIGHRNQLGSARVADLRKVGA